ncbi:MAG: hypothetical protein AB7N76_24205 [Planctomycetota bacterium]
MGFKRKRKAVEAVALDTLSPAEVEARIVAGVRRYATHEANWSQADLNTPFLGRIIGMGIESSNLADITMSIERQFLSRAASGDGEPEALRIPPGADATAATPGLAVQMLMDGGHLARDEGYLARVINFGHIVTIGAAHRLMARLERELQAGASPENVAALAREVRERADRLEDRAALLAEEEAVLAGQQREHDELTAALAQIEAQLPGADEAGAARLRSEQAELSSRLRLSEQRLRVAQATVAGLATRSPVEAARVAEVAAALRACAGRAAAG